MAANEYLGLEDADTFRSPITVWDKPSDPMTEAVQFLIDKCHLTPHMLANWVGHKREKQEEIAIDYFVKHHSNANWRPLWTELLRQFDSPMIAFHRTLLLVG